MHQQRGRRFFSAHLERQRREAEAAVRREMASEAGPSAPAIPPLPDWDSNVITPGTAFMARMSAHVRGFVREKLRCDPLWRRLAVVFSDSSEAGEGEHKIMGWIRAMRADPRHDPNTRHCVYGQDADLILLGLASHELHFRILRESGEAGLQVASAADAGGAPGRGSADHATIQRESIHWRVGK